MEIRMVVKMKKEILICMLMISTIIISGCTSTNENGYIVITSTYYPEDFWMGDTIDMSIATINHGNATLIYLKLENVDTDEIIAQYVSPYLIGSEQTYDFNFQFILNQATDFNGKISVGHVPDVYDTTLNIQMIATNTYENIGLYEHLSDPNNYLTVQDSSKIQINNLPRASQAKFRKAMNLTDFDLSFSFRLSRLDYGVINSTWASTVFVTFSQSPSLSRGNYDMQTSPANQSLSFYVEAFSSGSNDRIALLRDWRYPWGHPLCYKSHWGIQLNTTYDVRIYRQSGTVYLDMYNGTTLVWATSMPNISIAYGYFYPLMGVGVAMSPEVYTAGWFDKYKFIN